MTNNQKFLGLYNDLDDLLRKKYHNNDRTSSVFVKFVSDLNHTGSQQYIQVAKKLNTIRVIRNNLIHELDMNKDNFIEVTNDTIKFLEELIRLLEHPKTAKDIAKPIIFAYTLKSYAQMKINDLVHKMREKGFFQVPLLDDNMILKGVFSPNVLFEYLSHNPDACLENVTLKDVLQYCAISKHFSESYLFIREDMVEEDVDDIYMSSFNVNKKPVMIFVTKNGQPNEKVEGIIVLKDLLNSTFDSPIFEK